MGCAACFDAVLPPLFIGAVLEAVGVVFVALKVLWAVLSLELIAGRLFVHIGAVIIEAEIVSVKR